MLSPVTTQLARLAQGRGAMGGERPDLGGALKKLGSHVKAEGLRQGVIPLDQN